MPRARKSPGNNCPEQVELLADMLIVAVSASPLSERTGGVNV